MTARLRKLVVYCASTDCRTRIRIPLGRTRGFCGRCSARAADKRAVTNARPAEVVPRQVVIVPERPHPPLVYEAIIYGWMREA
jgi:hypothetical protein